MIRSCPGDGQLGKLTFCHVLCGNCKDGDIGSAFASSRLFVCFHLPICVSQLLLNPEMVKACPTLISYVYDFLENKAYSKGKGEFARKVPFVRSTDHLCDWPLFFCLFPKCINLFFWRRPVRSTRS